MNGLETFDDEKSEELESKYLFSVKNSKYFCYSCGEVPIITISEENKSFLDCNCLCLNKWSCSVKDFFGVEWLENNLCTEYSSFLEESEFTDSDLVFDIEFTKMKKILQMLDIWNDLIKTRKISGLFGLNLNKFCHHGFKFSPIEYFCYDCKEHICKDCYESQHKDHKTEELKDFIEVDKIQEKVNIIDDIKRLRIKENEAVFQTVNSMYKKLYSERKSTSTVNDERINLIKAYIDNRIINECWYIFVKFQIELFNNLEYNSNYPILKNVRDNNFLFIDREKFEIRKEELSFVDTFSKKAIDYFNNHYLISSTEVENFSEIFKSFTSEKVVPIAQIKLESSKRYGKHSVQINDVIVLQDDNIAVATNRKTIKIFNSKTMHKEMKYKRHNKAVNTLCTIGYNHFISGSDDGKIIRWDVKSAFCRFEFAMKLASTFSKGKKVAKDIGRVIKIVVFDIDKFAAISEDKSIRIFKNTSKPSQIGIMKEETSVFTALEYIKEGHRLVTCSKDEKIRFWDIKKLELIPKQTIEQIDCFSNHGLKALNDQILLVGGKNCITVIDLYRNIVVNLISESDLTEVSFFLPLSTSSFICSSKKYYHEYDICVKKVNLLVKSLHSHADRVGALIKLGSTSFLSGSFDSTLNKWSYSLAPK